MASETGCSRYGAQKFPALPLPEGVGVASRSAEACPSLPLAGEQMAGVAKATELAGDDDAIDWLGLF